MSRTSAVNLVAHPAVQVAFWCLMPLLLLTFQLVPVQPWTSTVVALGPVSGG